MRALLSIALLSAVAASANQPDVDFTRYQIIIDRAPFGALPAAKPEGANPNQPPAPSFAESLRLTMIVEEDGTDFKRIGFVDKRDNRSYTMGVGDEPVNGIVVVSADFDKEEAVFQQGDEMALMKLSSGETQKIVNGQPVSTAAPAPPPQAISYADRRRMRSLQNQPPPAPEPPPQPKYTGEALQKHLSEYKLDVIRQGLPALPIPLTPEEDAQLVKEGVLPPQP